MCVCCLQRAKALVAQSFVCVFVMRTNPTPSFSCNACQVTCMHCPHKHSSSTRMHPVLSRLHVVVVCMRLQHTLLVATDLHGYGEHCRLWRHACRPSTCSLKAVAILRQAHAEEAATPRLIRGHSWPVVMCGRFADPSCVCALCHLMPDVCPNKKCASPTRWGPSLPLALSWWAVAHHVAAGRTADILHPDVD